MYMCDNISQFFSQWEMFPTKFVEKTKHTFYFLWKSCHLWENVEKFCTARQATDDNVIGHMYCVLDTQDYRHTLRIRNTYSFSMTITAWTCWILYIHSLSNLYCNLSSNLTENFWVSTTKSICFNPVLWNNHCLLYPVIHVLVDKIGLKSCMKSFYPYNSC
jgi:hypothetical protein